MSKPWLRHRNITVTEDRQYDSVFSEAKTAYWTATMDGYAHPDGESVVMSREAASAGEAILLLKEALEEQGYEVRAQR